MYDIWGIESVFILYLGGFIMECINFFSIHISIHIQGPPLDLIL